MNDERIVRVPEPQEILAWIQSLPIRLKGYFRQPEHQVMWGIILLAAVLRLTYLDLIPLGMGEAQHLLQGVGIARGVQFPLIGVRSPQGIAHPPLMGYLMGIPLLLGRDPRVATAFIALLNVVAIAYFYRLVRRHYGLSVAVLSATLFAAAPWAVVISRRIAYEGILIPFAVWWFNSLHLALAERNPWGWVAACVILGLMLCTTFLALPLVFVFIILMLIYHPRVSWLHIVASICLIAIVFMPYLYYQNVHHLEDIRILLERIKDNAADSTLHIHAVRFATWIHSGQHLVRLAGPESKAFHLGESLFNQLSRLSGFIFLLSLPTAAVLAIRTWGHWKERQDTFKYVVVAIWLWVPLLIVFVQPGVLEPRSLAILYPVGFLAMGLLLDKVLGLPRTRFLQRSWWAPFLRLGLWLICLLLVVWSAGQVIYLWGFVAEHDVSDGYGVPYRFWRRTVKLVRREVKEAGTDQVWVITQGADIISEESPMLLHYLLDPQVKTVFLGQGGSESALLPAARPGVYLLTRSSPLTEDMIHQLRGENRGLVLFPDRQTRARVKVVEAQSVDEMLGLIRTRGLWALDSGLRLVGYDWPDDARPGQVVTFATYWTFLGVPPEERQSRHSLFSHLFTFDGVSVAQCEGFGLPERHWAEGLLLKQWCQMRLPANVPGGDYDLLIGMDRLSDLYRHRYIDDQGHPLGDAIPLGPLRVVE